MSTETTTVRRALVRLLLPVSLRLGDRVVGEHYHKTVTRQVGRRVLLGVGRRVLLGVGRRVLLGVDERERVDRRAREEGVPAVQCRRVGRLGGE